MVVSRSIALTLAVLNGEDNLAIVIKEMRLFEGYILNGFLFCDQLVC